MSINACILYNLASLHEVIHVSTLRILNNWTRTMSEESLKHGM